MWDGGPRPAVPVFGESPMQIAIASGKGGTGKTTVSTNLAYVASLGGQKVAYLDCDVEEPNGHLFLKPEITDSHAVGALVPQVDPEKCISCGDCGDICQYSAIVPIGNEVLTFPELCHSCGGCSLVCPTDAITEVSREMGRLELGHSGPIQFVHGILNIGEAMSPPVIRAVKASAPEADLILIDSPPGTSCPVIESIRGSDYVVLVTESTPFGLYDLTLAIELTRALGIPFGTVINRADLGDSEVARYCDQNGVPVLAQIRDDRRVAEMYSRGEMVARTLPYYRSIIEELIERITGEVGVCA